MKMKNILMVCFAALASVGLFSCSKDDNKTNNNDAPLANLDGTIWYYADGDVNGSEIITGYVLGFNQGLAGFTAERFNPQDYDSIEVLMECIGNYEYAAGNGSVHFYNEDGTVDYGIATFTVNGNTLTLIFNGKTMPFTRAEQPFGPDDPDDDDDLDDDDFDDDDSDLR